MFKLLNQDLYRPEKIYYLNSLEFAKKLNNDNRLKMIFHCLWRVPRDFGRKQLAVLKSIITSHKDKDIEINLWSNVDLSTNSFFKEVSEYVNLKLWDINEEIKGTILENCPSMSSVSDDMCYLEGDVFRLLVLHKYGGFYIDMDVLVLRDMSPLNGVEFLYQWGTSGFNANEPNITMNGAVMKLDKGSSLSLEFLEKLSITNPAKNTTCWGNLLYSKIQNNDLTILPGVWFNSEWGFEDTKCEPFKRVENYSLFDGAFTWHWHNQWDAEIEKGSKFEILEGIIEEKFKKITN
jgi:hypothetical protein